MLYDVFPSNMNFLLMDRKIKILLYARSLVSSNSIALYNLNMLPNIFILY